MESSTLLLPSSVGAVVELLMIEIKDILEIIRILEFDLLEIDRDS